MRENLQNRLAQLKTEFESGQKALADQEVRSANMRVVLHRISGAIQVLEEELAKAGHAGLADEQPTTQEAWPTEQNVAM